MDELFYPTIDLFLYDLRNGLGDSPEQIERSRQNFLNKLPENIRPLLVENFDSEEYSHLLKNLYAQFDSNQCYDGYYYPVLLGDSYGLLIDCALKNKSKAESVQLFKDIKAEILQRLQGEKATIGQTWMLSGWLPPSENKNQEQIAQACYKALIPDGDWETDLDGQGQFLGATIFELTQTNQHTVIILYPDEATLNDSGKFYADWMRLFYYQHKILWTYAQSRQLKKSLQTHFTTIKSGSDAIAQSRFKRRELETLHKILVEVQNTLNDYSRELTALNFQGGTIDINITNYEKRLGRIKLKAKKIKPTAETDLKFFTEFSKLAKDKYRLQITKDSENLERGLKLLSDTINAVRSRVEVEKAERDRNFQNFVTLLAAGWVFGSFIAALPGLSDKNDSPVRAYLIRTFGLRLSEQESTSQSSEQPTTAKSTKQPIASQSNKQPTTPKLSKQPIVSQSTKQPTKSKEPWWLTATTKAIYTIGGFIVAIVVLLVWRRLWGR